MLAGLFWGSKQTDTRGHILKDFILCNNVCLLNTSKHMYGSLSIGKMSSYDLTFISTSAFTDFVCCAGQPIWKLTSTNQNQRIIAISHPNQVTTLEATLS